MTRKEPESEALRVDKWLWHARFLKSRSLAAKLVTEGKLRINGERFTKAGKTIRPGDTLTFTLQDRVRVIKILALGTRRGPAPEAQALYEDLSPEPDIAAPKPVREPWERNRRKDKGSFNSA